MRLGYKTDPADDRDFRLSVDRAKLGVLPLTKRRVSWRDRLAAMRSQPSQNCVNEALSRAAHTTAEIAGTPIAYPSCLANYGVGRQLEPGNGPNARFLADDGSYPRLVMQGARQFGMVPLESYDDAEDPTKPVPFHVLSEGWHAKLTGFWRIDSSEEELLCAAIEHGRIPFVGRPVGDEYLGLRGSAVYDGLRGAPARGGHAEAIVGFNLDAPVPYAEVCGSWGVDFADGGIALVSLRSLMAESYDKYAIDVAPRI